MGVAASARIGDLRVKAGQHEYILTFDDADTAKLVERVLMQNGYQAREKTSRAKGYTGGWRSVVYVARRDGEMLHALVAACRAYGGGLLRGKQLVLNLRHVVRHHGREEIDTIWRLGGEAAIRKLVRDA